LSKGVKLAQKLDATYHKQLCQNNAVPRQSARLTAVCPLPRALSGGAGAKKLILPATALPTAKSGCDAGCQADG